MTPALPLQNFNHMQLCSVKDKHFSAFGGGRNADCLGTRVSSANIYLCFLKNASRKSPIKSSIQNRNKIEIYGEESRWRRNRMGRSLSLLQIHRKNN